MRGRIVRGVGGYYTVRAADGAEYTLRARGRFRKDGVTPLVGDNVLFTPGDGNAHDFLDAILPRSSELVRPQAANVTLLVVVVAPEPAPDLLLVDRLLVQAARSGFSSMLCVNKSDMDGTLFHTIRTQYSGSGAPVLSVSAMTGDGLDAVRERMENELCCMAGQSAVGKSTLLNALCGLSLRTGAVSERSRRGRHTTRHTELLSSGALSVLDTPGFSLLQLPEGITPETLRDFYPDYSALDSGCRFMSCLHNREPGCAVLSAVTTGLLDARRHQRYQTLLQEAQETWKGRYA
ncbi:MAG: ribosome small subunit-dependent GTPase A [Clostridia bacterium]|nr:ribosome small subunit-dependent GTPase A [Clostridia bacterium]